MSANYRVDRIRKSEDATKVPCGMNSIVYLDSKPPHRNFKVIGLKENEMLIYSQWSDKVNSFVVYRIN